MTDKSRSPYRVVTKPRVERQLARLGKRDLAAVRKKIRSRAVEPRPRRVLRLRDNEHRVRQGNWRIFYEIDDDARVVTVTDVLRRNDRTYWGPLVIQRTRWQLARKLARRRVVPGDTCAPHGR